MSKKNAATTTNNLPTITTKGIVEALVRKGWTVDDVCGNTYFIKDETLPESLYGSPVIDNIPNRDVVNSFVQNLGVPPVFCCIRPGRRNNTTVFTFGFEVVDNYSLRYLAVNSFTVNNNNCIDEILNHIKAEKPLYDVALYALVSMSINAFIRNTEYCRSHNLFDNVYLDVEKVITDETVISEVEKAVDYFINGYPLVENGHIGNCVIDASAINKWCTPLVNVDKSDWDFVSYFKQYLRDFYKNLKAAASA